MKFRFDDKLTVERFPDQKDWIEPMFRLLNDFMAQAGNALKGQLSFLDNFLGQERDLNFTYQSNTLSLPQKFTWELILPPKALQVVAATENGSPVALIPAWKLSDDGLIQLTDIVKVESTTPAVTALVAGARYKIRVRVTP